MATRDFTVTPESSIYEMKKDLPMEAFIVESGGEPDFPYELWEAKVDTPGQSPDVPIYSYGFNSDEAFDNFEIDLLISFERHDNYSPSELKGISNSRHSSLNQYFRLK